MQAGTSSSLLRERHRWAPPGCPALFEVATADFSGVETVRVAATFLVRGHSIKHVVLLAHGGCGY
jgi:hypothetical protein